MFGSILKTYRLSKSAVAVQNLLELHGAGSSIAVNAASIANRLVAAVDDQCSVILTGKRGKRPHHLSVAAAALALGIDATKNDRDAQLCFVLALGTILVEFSGKPQNYALSGNDHFLLDKASEVYLIASNQSEAEPAAFDALSTFGQ